MDYKYPPVYKYIILLILITSFLRYYKVLTKENFLLIAGIFTYMSFVFDYVLIENHPSLFYDGFRIDTPNKKVIYVKKNKLKPRKHKLRLIKDKFEIEHFENDEHEEHYDKKTLEDKFEEELKEQENEETDTDNLTEEIQRELDELDLE